MKPIYIHTEELHNLISPRIVVPELMKLGLIKTVLDIGCGTGTWLRAFQENGAKECIGIDGDHVDRSMLQIPDSSFIVQDLVHPKNLNRTFDLVLCLEVAEHIPESAADRFVKFIVQHGDRIVFGAAIPGQDGQNHLNEQWPTYWQEKFASHGYYFHDVLREIFWNDEGVLWWYSQNMFLITKEKNPSMLIPMVHPKLYLEIRKEYDTILSGQSGLSNSGKIFFKSLNIFIKKITGSRFKVW
jgi:SAM-dependent methyltransferase